MQMPFVIYMTITLLKIVKLGIDMLPHYPMNSSRKLRATRMGLFESKSCTS
jgi:hypothetical protein